LLLLVVLVEVAARVRRVARVLKLLMIRVLLLMATKVCRMRSFFMAWVRCLWTGRKWPKIHDMLLRWRILIAWIETLRCLCRLWRHEVVLLM
jgi:hypothetical protein